MTHSLGWLASWAGDGSDFFPGSVSTSVKLVTRKHSTPVHVCWADQLTWRITASSFTIPGWLLSTFQCVIGLLLHSSPWCVSTKNKLILISVSTRLAKNANGRHCIANITFELSLWTSGLIQKHSKKIMSYPWEVWGRQRISKTTYYLAYNNILRCFFFLGESDSLCWTLLVLAITKIKWQNIFTNMWRKFLLYMFIIYPPTCSTSNLSLFSPSTCSYQWVHSL